jgi:dihydrofolate reductase
MISLIAAVSDNNCLGKDGKLPWHIPADLEHFKRTTMGKTIVMGRKTFESIGRPLPGRSNVVLSKRKDLFKTPGIRVVNSVDEVLALDAPDKEIMIIGGGTLYRQFEPYASRCYLTQIHLDVDGDTYWKELPKHWKLTHLKPSQQNNTKFSFLTLERDTP